jgi:hypothetical protein
MASRSVGLSAMFGWIGDTFRLIGRDPGAFLGASATSLVAYLGLFLPFIGYSTWQTLQQGGSPAAPFAFGTTYWVLYGLTILASLLLLPPILVGWFRLCREVDGGAKARALDILAPYRDRSAWGRALATALLMMVVTIALFALLAMVFWSSFQAVFAQAAAQQAATLAGATIASQPPPVGFFVGYAVLMVVILVLQFVYMVAFADVSLRQSAPVAALRDAFAGVGRNSPKLLLFAVCIGIASIVVMVLVGLVVGLLFMALSMLGTAVMVIGMLLLYIPLLLLMYPIMFAGSYFVWKSILGDAAPPPVPDAGFGVLPA